MIIVTLVATLASAMVWQQWRAVQVESAERARGQAAWILAGALDFGLLILREDRNSPNTNLSNPWATPLAESRLSTFLSADNTATDSDDGPEAFLSGTIVDAQSKYNLANLVASDPAVAKKELTTLKRLCDFAGVDPGVATLIANRLTAASAAATDSTAVPLVPKTVAQLSWFGIDAASIRALEPYVILLPTVTQINVNTAPKEVLAAATGVDIGTAESITQTRQRTPFTSLPAFYDKLKITGADVSSQPTVAASSFFEVNGRLRLSDHVVTQHALVRRLPNNNAWPTVIQRELVSTVEEPGS